MRYFALACDYDGTLAHHGQVDQKTIDAIKELKKSGRRAILVTGRELDDLENVFPELNIFDCIVGENGGLLYFPASRTTKLLAAPPQTDFVEALKAKKVEPLSVGKTIVATWEPNERIVMDVIRALGLELQIIFNKGAVMVLPSGVNKASGLRASLQELLLSPHNVVAIGDAENDHAFLKICECSVATHNAVDSLKDAADFVTSGDHGNGVCELIEMILADDLASIQHRLVRHHLEIGKLPVGAPVSLPAYGSTILIAGTSGGGKSTLASAIMESMLSHDYQFCIVDPEGDYQGFENSVVHGNQDHPPQFEEVLTLLEKRFQNVIVNLLAVGVDDRPKHFENFFPLLLKLRKNLGRPHWIIIDETHHLLPESWDPSSLFPQKIFNLLMITVHPDHISKSVLQSVDTIIAIGKSPNETLGLFSERLGQKYPQTEFGTLEAGEAILWKVKDGKEPFKFQSNPSKSHRKRHIRKYAEGELGPDRSFYFRGLDEKLNLRAENLMSFIKLAEGVDDDTWLHHLRQHDYSRWFRQYIKDEDLASAALEVENNNKLSPQESRSIIRKAIEKNYTAPV
jgi:hydroxymethylpyrimidine pyrophosphatase-like HAD family hydrolase